MKRYIRKTDITFWGLLLLAFISVYVFPVAALPFFLLLIIFVFYNKEESINIALLFVFIDAPGRLFPMGALHAQYTIPLIPVVAGVSISTLELLLYAIIIKGFLRKSKHVFTADYILLFAYLGLLIVFSLMVGMSPANIVMTFRDLSFWLLLFAIPSLCPSFKDFVKIARLLFPIVILAVVFQIFSYTVGGVYLNDYLQGLTNAYEETRTYRIYSSMMIILFSLFMSTFLIYHKKNYFNRKYLMYINTLCYLSVILSATRGWIIAFTVFFILVNGFWIQKNIKSIIGYSILYILLANFLLAGSNIFTNQVSQSFNRFSTVGELLDGDNTAGGTLSRLTERGPRVMRITKESLLVGWGFSSIYYAFRDQHVGNINILLNIGIVGAVLLVLFYLRWITMFYKLRKIVTSSVYGDEVILFLFMFLTLFVIHSSSMQFLGFNIEDKSAKVFITMYISLFVVIYSEVTAESSDQSPKKHVTRSFMRQNLKIH